VVVRVWQRALLGALLVGAVAAAGIALNFTLLRLTQDAHDPVGKLSPRVVFSGETPTGAGPVTTITTKTDDSKPRVPARPDGPSDGDSDD
jgi:hypothetical protein